MKDAPESEEDAIADETPSFSKETIQKIQEKLERVFSTEVFERNNQQYIGEVRFQIVDKDSRPIPNLPVTLHSDPRSGVTNADGVVVFSDVPTGEHTLVFAYGEEEVQKNLTIGDMKQSSGTVKGEMIVVVAQGDTVPLWAWGVIFGLSIALLWALIRLRLRREKVQ
jgi:hypothetical protein